MTIYAVNIFIFKKQSGYLSLSGAKIMKGGKWLDFEGKADETHWYVIGNGLVPHFVCGLEREEITVSKFICNEI